MLDAYYLKGSCLGELIAAIEIDKNDGMYPIAWAIMEAESKDLTPFHLPLRFVFEARLLHGMLDHIQPFPEF